MAKKRLISVKHLFKDNDNTDDTDDGRDDAKDDATDDTRRRKQRVFDNKRNQFLVHFYAKIDENLNEFLDDFCDHFREKYPKNIEFLADRHVTLGDGFPCLKYHEIQEFLRLIDEKIEKKFFELKFCLNSFEFFENSNQKRFFVAFCDKNSKNCLKKREFLSSLSALWSDHFPSAAVTSGHVSAEEFLIHISIISFEKDFEEMGRKITKEMNERLKEKCFLFSIKEFFLSIGTHLKRKIQLNSIKIN